MMTTRRDPEVIEFIKEKTGEAFDGTTPLDQIKDLPALIQALGDHFDVTIFLEEASNLEELVGLIVTQLTG